MEDASDENKGVALSLDSNNDNGLAGRVRSESASSGHKRSSSGSLLSRLSFLRMIQANQTAPERDHHHHSSGIINKDGGSSDFGSSSSLLGGRTAMSSALQHRRTRRRRGSLRKTALLGTRLDYRDKKTTSSTTTRTPVDVLRNEHTDQPHKLHQQPLPSTSSMPPPPPPPLSENTLRSIPHKHQPGPARDDDTPGWETIIDQRGEGSLPGDVTTDDEDIVSFPRMKNSNAAITAATAAGLHLPTASASPDSYYALQADPAYRSMAHRTTKSALSGDMASSTAEMMAWDYSETEWWGYIILIVTWLVFVVGMGSCFGVWSWAWDVGETPYAPPELEDDPTLPIVGYYPALIILTAVMSWVWVIIAWVGMKYFKHANISGEDI